MANISYLLGTKQTASEILSSVAGHDLVGDWLDRVMTHLRANQIDVDRPVITAGAWLEMDPATEEFTNGPEANGLVRRQDRKPFVIPQIA